MKRYLLLILISCLAIGKSVACEICGCANGNFQIGLLPNYQHGFFGVRYTSSQFHSRVRDDASEFSKDYYGTAEIWGGYSIGKFQFLGFIPYVLSRKVSDDGTTVQNGIGDAMVILNYRIVNLSRLSKNESRSVHHDLYIGAGIKFPTGIDRVDTTDPEFNIGDFNSQAGTGSIDYLVNATHQVTWGRSGIVTNASFRFNMTNAQGYRFGNRTYASTAYYYELNAGNTQVKPTIGVNYQSNAINSFDGAEVPDSNGYNFNALVGVNVSRGRAGMNTMAYVPVMQNLYDGQTKLQSRVMVGLTWSF